MQASQVRLVNLTGGQQQFQIPLYQRTYSWVERNLKQLWSDIVDQAVLVEEGKTGSHFLGSIVFAPSPSTEVSFARHLVIDGQQRLTTLLIALIAVRDHVAETDPGYFEQINELYLVNKFAKQSDYLKLVPTQTDRPSFEALVNRTHSGGNDQIYETYRFFSARLESLGEDSAEVSPRSIQQAITSSLDFVSITADKGDNVHRIFESINNTGARLSQADLMRNHVFMRLPSRAEHVYHKHWIPLQQSMTNDQLERLMWLVLVLDGESKVSQADLYGAQQRRFETHGGDEDAVEAYVERLHQLSASWLRIVAPGAEAGPIGDCLRRIKRWDASTTDPVVLLLLDACRRAEISDEELVRGLSYIESVLVRRMLCRRSSNSLNRMFQELPAQAASGAKLVDGIQHALSKVKNGWPDDDEVREAIRSQPLYDLARRSHLRFVLRRLEQDHDHPEKLDFDGSELTIEHIMPQSPVPEWLSVLAEETVDGESPRDLHERIVHTLGNLTLTGVNAQLSNHVFERKKQLFQDSHLEMNKHIATLARWGAREIEDRADQLARRACQIWPAPLAAAVPPIRRDFWKLVHQALAAFPEGTWTTYGNLAALIGSHAVPVSRHLADAQQLPNAFRVLTSTGMVSEGFRWNDPDDARDVHEELRRAGVLLDAHGTADPSQLLSVSDLVALVGLAEPLEPADSRELDASTRAQRFRSQLAEANSPAVVAAVDSLAAGWVGDGGWLAYGPASVTSCFPMLDRPGDESIWPCAIVPSSARGTGRIEVVFQYLLNRRPFGDADLREQLRLRLNRLDGVTIPSGKISLRPSFDLTVLETAGNTEALIEAFAWFRESARSSAG